LVAKMMAFISHHSETAK